MQAAENDDEGGGDGDSEKSPSKGQNGVWGSAAMALWEKLRPFAGGEDTDGFGKLSQVCVWFSFI